MLKKEKLPKRNDKCPCGSGKKAKRCCLPHMKTILSVPKNLRQQFLTDLMLSNKKQQ